MEMHKRIKCYIETNGLKFNFVAEKSGIDVQRFYRLINGNSPLTVDEYETMCKGLSVDPGYFFKDFFLENKKLKTRKVN